MYLKKRTFKKKWKEVWKTPKKLFFFALLKTSFNSVHDKIAVLWSIWTFLPLEGSKHNWWQCLTSIDYILGKIMEMKKKKKLTYFVATFSYCGVPLCWDLPILSYLSVAAAISSRVVVRGPYRVISGCDPFPYCCQLGVESSPSCRWHSLSFLSPLRSAEYPHLWSWLLPLSDGKVMVSVAIRRRNDERREEKKPKKEREKNAEKLWRAERKLEHP